MYDRLIYILYDFNTYKISSTSLSLPSSKIKFYQLFVLFLIMFYELFFYDEFFLRNFYEVFTNFFLPAFYEIFTKLLPNFYEVFTKNFYETFTKFLRSFYDKIHHQTGNQLDGLKIAEFKQNFDQILQMASKSSLGMPKN